MFTEVHRRHAHAILSVWPKFDPGSENFNALQTADALIKPAVNGTSNFYDPFKTEGRTLYWKQLRDQLFTKGVDAWWLDAEEPELGGAWGEFRTSQTSAGIGAFVFNALPLMTTSAVYEGQRSASRDQRVLILTRVAYAGQQRNATVTAVGEVNGDWATLKRRIPAGLNFSLQSTQRW
jgi:alpha-D-xyloside xylohydrolase